MLRKLWRSFEIFAAVCVLILLVGSLVLAVATGSFTDDQKAGASTGNAGTSSGPSGYNTLFYDPEPPELTPEQEWELFERQRYWDQLDNQ